MATSVGRMRATTTPASVIDEYKMVVDPVALGKGRSMFDGMPGSLNLKLTKSRTFKNGKVLLCYGPA